MNPNVNQVLTTILNEFKNGHIPEAVAYAMYPIPDIPSAKWSLLNRTIMFLAGTEDARGYRQWQKAKRHVKKGAKAFHILVPCLYKRKDEEGEEIEFLKGFKGSPVFRYEDTDGKPLDYKQIELPKLPLIEQARSWGIAVKAVPGNYRYCGYYSQDRQEIGLATKEECVFFHELAHCGHEKVKGRLKAGQDPLQEITAELAAQALCRLIGKSGDRHLGNSYRYIERYAQKIKLSPASACTRVLGEVEQVLNLILNTQGGATTD